MSEVSSLTQHKSGDVSPPLDGETRVSSVKRECAGASHIRMVRRWSKAPRQFVPR